MLTMNSPSSPWHLSSPWRNPNQHRYFVFEQGFSGDSAGVREHWVELFGDNLQHSSCKQLLLLQDLGKVSALLFFSSPVPLDVPGVSWRTSGLSQDASVATRAVY